MTSNLTGPQTGKPGLGFTPDCADIRAQTILREAFSPEFSGRIDCIASFRPLAAEDLARIAALQLRELAERLKRQNVALEFAPELPEHLGALCANEPGGARSLRRRLQTEIEGPAAELLLRDPSVRTLRVVWRQESVQVEAPGTMFLKHTFKIRLSGIFHEKRRRISAKIFSKKGCNLCKQNVLYY